MENFKLFWVGSGGMGWSYFWSNFWSVGFLQLSITRASWNWRPALRLWYDDEPLRNFETIFQPFQIQTNMKTLTNSLWRPRCYPRCRRWWVFETNFLLAFWPLRLFLWFPTPAPRFEPSDSLAQTKHWNHSFLQIIQQRWSEKVKLGCLFHSKFLFLQAKGGAGTAVKY